MFLTEMSEFGKDEIRLSGIRMAELRKLVGYLYTGEVEVDGERVQDLLLAANMWQFSAIQTACEMYLDSHLDTCNCIGVMVLAKAVCCWTLLDRARNLVITQFSSAKEDPCFLELGENEVKEILDSEELVIKSEEDTFTAVLKWVNHNTQQRLPSFPRVLHCVRLTHLRLSTLKRLAQHPLVLEANECLEMITNSQVYLQERRCDQQMKIRRCATHEIVVLFGQQDQETQKAEVCDVICYDEEDDSWRKVTRMPQKLSLMSVTVEGDIVYVTGGSTDINNPEGVQRCAYTYSFLQDTWKELPDMHVGRYGHISAVEKGRLYVVGGQQNGKPTSVEMYTEDTNTWTICCPCPDVPMTVQACVSHGNLYLLGGMDPTDTGLFSEEGEDSKENDGETLKFKFYDPTSNVWNTVEDTAVQVKAAGVYGNQILIWKTNATRPMLYNPVNGTTEKRPDHNRLSHVYTTGQYGSLFQWSSEFHDYLYRYDDSGEHFQESVTDLPFSVWNPVTVTVDKLSFGWFCRDLDLFERQESNISIKEGKAAETV
ncbi:kelch-like protein 3 [Branchiostoma floridae]|uniref:Kelch-like protein 20 n=1 Tax=Branchiostoma floridae TaxID=7739 RepID=A0A9J7N2L2_BRAFL|nr:kelch-like protein 3 [Branchiostoma floridae]